MPKFADDPAGLGIIEGLTVDLGEGLFVADFVAFGEGEVIFSPSFTVILIF
jgi:hypothetical protein